MTTRPVRIAAVLMMTACAHRETQPVAAVENPAPAAPAADAAAAPAADAGAPAAAADQPAQPAAAPAPPPDVNLAKLMADGTAFVCEMADSNAKDSYTMKVVSMKKGLTWDWWTGSDPTAGDHGTVKTDERSLKSAKGVAFISQGHVTPKKAKATPPFLISRSAAKALRDGKPVKLGIYDIKGDELKPAGTETKTVTVDGTESSVSTMKAEGDKVTVWIADDPKWPVLVAASFDGDDYIKLTEVHTSK